MEFKKKYPCTQCIFLTTKESTLAKHMKRHQNITEGHQASNSSSPPSSDTLPVLGSAKSKLPTFLKSTISEETNPQWASPLDGGFSRKNIFCQKIFDNFFSFQATEMVLTSKWGRIQQEIQI